MVAGEGVAIGGDRGHGGFVRRAAGTSDKHVNIDACRQCQWSGQINSNPQDHNLSQKDKNVYKHELQKEKLDFMTLILSHFFVEIKLISHMGSYIIWKILSTMFQIFQ